MAKGQFGKGNPGKPKGATNKMTRTVKDAVLQVFTELQENPDGVSDLRAWAKKKPGDFYQIAAKLIPSEVNAKVSMVRVGKDALDETYEDETEEK